jgi:hypothetical protein
MSDPTPDLAYGFQPPDTVYVTLDDAEPVHNKLVLAVMNASTSEIGFNNPEGLTPSSDLPAISDPAPNPLDRLYVWFPWGEGAGDLSYPGDASSIGASSLGPGWASPVQLSDPTIGVYWILFPLSKTVLLGPQESVEFEFDGIVSHLPAGQTTGMTISYVEPRVAGWTPTVSNVNVFKREPLGIVSFTVLPATALPNQEVTAAWSTTGADAVELEPGGHTALSPTSQLDVPVSAPTTFRLTAYGVNQEPVERRQAVSVLSGWVELAAGTGGPFGPSYVMSTLFELENDLVYLSMNGAWSSADGRNWTLMPSPSPFGFRSTPYTGVLDGSLWVMGGLDLNDGQPLNDLWSSADGGATWEQAGTAQWGPRSAGGCATFLDRLWIAGGTQGNYYGKPPAVDDSVWSSDDGVNWANAEVPWGPRVNPGLALWNGRLWVAGGSTSSGFLSDTWSTADGVAWEQSAAPAPWGANFATLIGTPGTLYAITHYMGRASAMWTLDGETWTPVDQVPPLSYVDGMYGPVDAFGTFLGMPMTAGSDGVWVYAPPVG